MKIRRTNLTKESLKNSPGENLYSTVHTEKMAGNWDRALELGESGISQEMDPEFSIKIQLVLAEIHIR